MGHVAQTADFRNAYRIPVGKPKRKKPLSGVRRRLEDIKM